MSVIYLSVRVAPVRGALSHGDHGNYAYDRFSLLYYSQRLLGELQEQSAFTQPSRQTENNSTR